MRLSFSISAVLLAAASAWGQAALSQFSLVQHRNECGGWYFLSTQKGGETLYGMADRNGNVVVADARRYKQHKGYIEFYLLDAEKKAAHDQWKLDMKQYETDYAKYKGIKAKHDADMQAYKVKLEAAKQEAEGKWRAAREEARAQAEYNAKVEQQKRAQQQQAGGWLGALAGALSGVSDAVAVNNAVNAVKFEPFYEQVKANRGLLVAPSAPYNPMPTKPKEPADGYYWASYPLRQPNNYAYIDYEKIAEGDGFADMRTNDGLWGLVDASLNEVVPAQHHARVLGRWYDAGRCRINTDAGFGVIDKKGRTLVKPVYTQLVPLGDNGYIASLGSNKQGVISLDDKVKLPLEYSSVDPRDGLLFATRNGMTGLYTTDCMELYPCQFQDVKLTKANDRTFLLNKVKGQWGVIDYETGRELLPCQFATVETMAIGKNQDCFKVTAAGKMGLYSDRGSVLLPCDYTDIRHSGDYFIVQRGEYSGLFTTYGMEMLPADRYDSFTVQTLNLKGKADDMAVFMTMHGGLKGIASRHGQELIPCDYLALEWLKELHAFAVRDVDGKWGVRSLGGDEILPCVLDDVPAYLDTHGDYIMWGVEYGAVDFNGQVLGRFKKYAAGNTAKLDKALEKADKKNGGASTRAAREKREMIALSNDKVLAGEAQERARRARFSYYAQTYVERIVNDWQRRGEFEKVDDWRARVNDKTRSQKIFELTSEAQKSYIALSIPTLPKDNPSIVGSYDPDNETYRIKTAYSADDLLVHVPTADAQEFKANFAQAKAQPSFFIQNDGLALSDYSFTLPGGRHYSYSNKASLTYALANVEYNFNPVEIDGSASNNNFKGGKQTITTRNLNYGTSDIDVAIPQATAVNNKTYAIIIANENYRQEAAVDYAYNDGQTFRQYCTKALGIPEKNVHFRADASLNDMRFEFNWLKQMAAACEGDASFIVYYAGHGMPDAKNKDAYLLPVDGYSSDIASGYSLAEFYDMLGSLPAQNTLAFLDACFSGSQRDGSSMSKGDRGVAITPDLRRPKGNLVVFSATAGNETAHAWGDKQHGMFTYYLLKKIKEHDGPLSMGDLASYVKREVKTTALKEKNLSQTPTVTPSPSMTAKWQKMTVK